MADLGRIVTRSTLVFKLSLITLLITLIVHIVGYSTNSWTRAGNEHGHIKHGLWKLCECFKSFFSKDMCICTPIPSGSGWHIDTVRALESLGLIAILLALLFAILGRANEDGKKWKLTAALFSFASSLFILVGIIVYATTVATGEFLHYSFGLCTVAGCGVFASGCLLLADKNTAPRPEGGTVLHYPNQSQVAAIQPGYANQGQFVGSPYQPNVPPPLYNQVQYFSGHTVMTTSQGAAPAYIQPGQGSSAPPYAQPTQAGQPPPYTSTSK